MNEMVDRVAKALCRSDTIKRIHASKADLIDQQVEKRWKTYIVHAKAAIEAMREPTDQQRNNYFKTRKATGESDMGSCFIDSHWESMIDAALKE